MGNVKRKAMFYYVKLYYINTLFFPKRNTFMRFVRHLPDESEKEKTGFSHLA